VFSHLPLLPNTKIDLEKKWEEKDKAKREKGETWY